MFSTRALLDQHQRDCREDRERTAGQFSQVSDRISALDTKIDKLDEKNDRKHAENVNNINKVLRYIWIAMGMFAMLSFLISHDGLGEMVKTFLGGK